MLESLSLYIKDKKAYASGWRIRSMRKSHMVKILIAPSSHHSRRLSVVVPQKSAEPLATSDSPRTMPYSNGGKQQDVAFALMIALSVEVRNVFGECSPQGALTEQNQLGQTLLFH